ncbi:unnamed protein product [Diamesa serratosioi]
MKSFVILLAIVACASAVTLKDLYKEEWITFKALHSKVYDSKKEELARLEIYLNNRNEIVKHNQKYANKEVSYLMGTNSFSDLTSEEFLEMMTVSNLNVSEIQYGSTFIGAANVKLPTSVDWRIKGAVTPVKDQEGCLSSWTFSTTGALEGQHFRKTNKIVSLSEQSLIDCSMKNGCKGGWMNTAFMYIMRNGGIDTEQSYPYKGVEGRCAFNKLNIGAKCRGYSYIPRRNEPSLMNAVVTIGPISVAINVEFSFHHYRRGVYYEPKCNPNKLNHAALVVGYGSEGGYDYWLVKNSWGSSWGEDGYIKMVRNRGNNCGIATAASYPLV